MRGFPRVPDWRHPTRKLKKALPPSLFAERPLLLSGHVEFHSGNEAGFRAKTYPYVKQIIYLAAKAAGSLGFGGALATARNPIRADSPRNHSDIGTRLSRECISGPLCDKKGRSKSEVPGAPEIAGDSRSRKGFHFSSVGRRCHSWSRAIQRG